MQWALRIDGADQVAVLPCASYVVHRLPVLPFRLLLRIGHRDRPIAGVVRVKTPDSYSPYGRTLAITRRRNATIGNPPAIVARVHRLVRPGSVLDAINPHSRPLR